MSNGIVISDDAERVLLYFYDRRGTPVGPPRFRGWTQARLEAAMKELYEHEFIADVRPTATSNGQRRN